MTSETVKLKSTLDTLNNALDDLEGQLEPLLAQTFPETVVGLETIQQAKLQTVFPYLVYVLTFIYLKARGIDPKSHAVVSELDRVRQYFEKIKDAEDANQNLRRTGIDKAASLRFIKHAIAQSKHSGPPSENAATSSSQDSNESPVPVKVTSKMAERVAYEKQLKELGSEEEDDLEVFGNADVEVIEELAMAEGERNPDLAIMQESQMGTKRRRPIMDPFAGYGDGVEEAETIAGASVKKKIATWDDIVEGTSGRSTPISTTSSVTSAKAKKKAQKKAKRMMKQ